MPYWGLERLNVCMWMGGEAGVGRRVNVLAGHTSWVVPLFPCPIEIFGYLIRIQPQLIHTIEFAYTCTCTYMQWHLGMSQTSIQLCALAETPHPLLLALFVEVLAAA